MIKAMRDFIREYQDLESKALVNVEYLPKGPINYSIMEEALVDAGKGVGVVKSFMNGTKIKELRYRLLRNADYEQAVATNIANSKFMEDFSKWIIKCNKEGKYPVINGVLSIETTTSGYIESVANDQTHAIYTVGLRVTYLEKE